MTKLKDVMIGFKFPDDYPTTESGKIHQFKLQNQVNKFARLGNAVLKKPP